MKRRTILTALGASATGIMGTVATANSKNESDGRDDIGSVDNEQVLPIKAEGRMIHRFKPVSDDNDLYQHQKRFISDDLMERYGRRTLEYETEYVGEEWVPQNEKEDSTEQDTIVTQRDGIERTLGSVEEHRVSEERLRQNRNEVATSSISIGDVPLYHYASESDADDGSIFDRQAPINVVWEDYNTEVVQSNMELGTGMSDEWDNTVPTDYVAQSPRYAPCPNTDTVYSTDGDIQKNEGTDCSLLPNSLTQYHIRMYSFEESDIGSFGQVHWDPCDHNQDWVPGGDDDDPWNYTEAREEVASAWEGIADVEEYDLGNDVGIHAPEDTHDGEVAYIY
ncbi:hypothetical protein [Natrialba sp. SSL1]|uniref:hypothetical protein n=1 Tax=Natrialba sp. SSL1 TaxID=1869245 RepID=UPI001114267C|nr:hypothetical protein [Natrialba sp. SSL1]